MLRGGKTLVFALVFAGPFPMTSFVTAQKAIPSSPLVRPCTANENAVGASSEVIRLFADERPTFNWCEAVDVPWLPNAEILRFHTAIHVDYSSVCTIVKAASESPVRLIWAAGEGMVTTPSPSLPNNLNVMNSLLKSVPALKDSQLGSAGVLYLFLIHREIRQSFFSKPGTSYPFGRRRLPDTLPETREESTGLPEYSNQRLETHLFRAERRPASGLHRIEEWQIEGIVHPHVFRRSSRPSRKSTVLIGDGAHTLPC
jgi:hypothetical protein